MPHFKCEMSVFMGQLRRRVRIAVRILCISWHMRHPPKAMKNITCRVMSFRPWQASCVPLRGLSRLHSPFSLTLLPPCFPCVVFLSSPLCHATLFFVSSLGSCSLLLFPSLFSISFFHYDCLLVFHYIFSCCCNMSSATRPTPHRVPQNAAMS